jgi:hypothetical protein
MSEYFKDGKWYEVKWNIQCPQQLGHYKCQAVLDHKGPCWCYREDGAFLHKRAGTKIVERVYPNNPKYPQAYSMMNHCYLHQREERVITDPVIIGKLNLTKQGALD